MLWLWGSVRKLTLGGVSALVLLGALICTGTLAGTPMVSRLFDDQQLKVVFVKWEDVPVALVLEGEHSGELQENELVQLRELGLKGRFSVIGTSVTGSGTRSRAVIVMQRQASTQLLQPHSTSVVYIQFAHSWRRFPPNERMTDRKIVLEPSPQSPNVTRCSVELAGGGWVSSDKYHW
jgi:hypothetical protein